MLCDKLMSHSSLEPLNEAVNHLASSGHWKHLGVQFKTVWYI